jgi:hypothetical protein
MAITNVSGSLADNVGSYLFEHIFNSALYPVILVAAASPRSTSCSFRC